MMMPPPEELVGLLLACALGGIWLAWLVRADWRTAGGRIDPWRAIEDAVGLFLMLAMLAASTVQVIARYALADSVTLPWTEEFSRLALVWAAMWGAATVQRSDDHIAMTVLHDWLPEGARRIVRLFGDLVVLAVLVPITWLGWETARALDIMSSISLGMPLSIFAYPVPIAGALMMVHTALLILRRLAGRPIPSADMPEV